MAQLFLPIHDDYLTAGTSGIRPVVKAFTLMQPFAGLVASGKKKLETRTWQTKYRGPLLICAGMGIFKGEMLVYEDGRLYRDNCRQYTKQNRKECPPGVMMCLVDLINVRPMVKFDEAEACIAYRPELYAWELENVRLVVQKPVKGKRSFWPVPLHEIEIKY